MTGDITWIDKLDIDTLMDELKYEEGAEIDLDTAIAEYRTKFMEDVKTMPLAKLQQIYNLYILDQRIDKQIDSIVVLPINDTDWFNFEGYGLGD